MSRLDDALPDEDQLAPSALQQLVSELFRIALCRNDDHNLALSSVTKSMQQAPKKKAENKDKLIVDLRSREDERLAREAEILKELGLLNKTYLGLTGYSGGSVEKHIKKMVRKCLILTVDQPQKAQGVLAARLPSHLHVASIMGERTDDERQTFGKVRLTEFKRGKVKSDAYFTEDVIDQLIEVYITEMKAPYDLIVKTLERSRDRF